MDAIADVPSHPPRIASHPSSCWKSTMERQSEDQGLPYAVGKEKDELKIFAAEF